MEFSLLPDLEVAMGSHDKFRFETLLRYLRFCPPEEFESTQDRWAPVCRLVDKFNKRRAETFYPSWSICVDEKVLGEVRMETTAQMGCHM